MREDRIKWNQKYRDKNHSRQVSEIVKRFFPLAPPGCALDIATGNGGNAIFLARKGYTVHAVDIADEAIFSLAGLHPNLRPICADLDLFDIPADTYSLIVNTRYLNRRLTPGIMEGLITGGVLIFETFFEDPRRPAGGKFCRDYLLRQNELLHAFLPLTVRFYRETENRQSGEPGHIASLVAVK